MALSPSNYIQRMTPTPDPVKIDLSSAHSESFGFAIKRLRVQGGTWINPPRSGVTAVVGGNNVGKSTLLRQVVASICGEPNSDVGWPPLLSDLEQSRAGSAADLILWLTGHYGRGPGEGAGSFIRPGDVTMPIRDVETYWTNPHWAKQLSTLGRYFVQYADAEQRFEAVKPVSRREDLTYPPQNPLHQVEDDPKKLGELSLVFEEAFGQPLLLDPLSGSLILRVGRPGIAAPPVDQIEPDYREAVGKLPRIDQQGDGMRSMLGVLLPVLAGAYPVVVVDEPEAFLHPPQARILGRALGELANESGVQVFLATHDRNILTGLLDAKQTDITVVRLTRHADRTTALQLNPERLRAVWSNPALRYSNVLDGLFHRMVVLAENERDCRFYAASLDSAHQDGATDISPNDVLFVPTAGKSNMKALASILVACGVPVVACGDLDVINDESTLKSLVEALGHSWEPLRAKWSTATAEFRTAKAPRLNKDVATAVSGVLHEAPDGVYDTGMRKRITATLRVESPWHTLKDFGERAFKAAPQAGQELLAELDSRGVVLVREGELEGFARTLEVGKGLGWTEAAITAGAHESVEARSHIKRVVTSGLSLEAASQAERRQ